MKVVVDIETDALVDPKHIWLGVFKDIESDNCTVFRNVTEDLEERERLIKFLKRLWSEPDSLLIGHNLLNFDWPVLNTVLGLVAEDVPAFCIDTLILSKLIDYSRDGHSIEDYGLEFNLPKGKFIDFSKYSQDMEDYCVRDVDVCHRIYLKYLRYISDPAHAVSIRREHQFQGVVNQLHTNGFAFNKPKAEKLLAKVTEYLAILDKDILEAFPPRLKMIREVMPKETKYGTISLSSIPRVLREHTSEFTVGAPFCHCVWSGFNPSSHKQIIDVLNKVGWRPEDKTKTHIDTERELNRYKYQKHKTKELDLSISLCNSKLVELRRTGWKVNEANLETLPPTAPPSARFLAKRILLESRRRTLTEWLALVTPDGRIHGKFYGIGAWTHRMAHQAPNTANIPNEFDTAGKKKLLGKELRSLWQAPVNRLLVGVDAEGIQLRIFAHLIDDPEFTKALVDGKKEDKSDPHSLNQKILGTEVCKSRQAAKRFIYALLLGAGTDKLAEILGCTAAETDAALQRLMGRYQGFEHLKSTTIPADGKRGWFTGLDGRAVRIPGDTVGQRRHLAMSGYLQSGEAIVMKAAAVKWADQLKDYDAKLVNFVHDEWQTECPNNMEVALSIAKLQADSLRLVGEELKLRCPLAGSYWNDDAKDYTIHTDWSRTH